MEALIDAGATIHNKKTKENVVAGKVVEALILKFDGNSFLQPAERFREDELKLELKLNIKRRRMLLQTR